MRVHDFVSPVSKTISMRNNWTYKDGDLPPDATIIYDIVNEEMETEIMKKASTKLIPCMCQAFQPIVDSVLPSVRLNDGFISLQSQFENMKWEHFLDPTIFNQILVVCNMGSDLVFNLKSSKKTYKFFLPRRCALVLKNCSSYERAFFRKQTFRGVNVEDKDRIGIVLRSLREKK